MKMERQKKTSETDRQRKELFQKQREDIKCEWYKHGWSEEGTKKKNVGPVRLQRKKQKIPVVRLQHQGAKEKK